MAKHRQTKACDISNATKEAVLIRDGGRCILCGSYDGQPNAHYIPRSHGGLGIEQNIVTLCPACHRQFDSTVDRPFIKMIISDYLRSKYPVWDESKLYYKKYDF